MGLKPADDGVKHLLGGNYFGDKGMRRWVVVRVGVGEEEFVEGRGV